MQYSSGLLSGLALCAILTGCEKTLDIEYNVIEPLPVIEGILTENEGTVRFTMTTPMNEPMDLTPVKDATITITDVTEPHSETLILDEDGLYHSQRGGIPGHVYRLEVSRNGKKHYAESVMAGAPEITDMQFDWISMPYDKVAVLQVAIEDDISQKGDCYWLKVFRNGEIYKWMTARDNQAHDGSLEMVMMTTRNDIDSEEEDELLLEGDIIRAEVTKISQQMYDYLVAISADSNGPQMYTGDKALGYFLPAGVSSKTIEFPARP